MIAAGGIFRCGLLLSAAFSLPMSSWSAQTSTKEFLDTRAGALVIEQIGDEMFGKEFYVYLNNQIVLHSSSDGNSAFQEFPVPHIIMYVGVPIGPFDAVTMFQQLNWGTACPGGGPIWLLGISHNGSFTRSNTIDNCGRSSPRVAINNDVIRVALPDTGQGSVAEEWTCSSRLRLGERESVIGCAQSK